MKHTILATALLALTSMAHAAESAVRLALDVNLASYHTESWARHHLNQSNPGLGIEAQFTPDGTALAGFYRNSYRRTSAYALGAWTPLHAALPLGIRLDAGLAAGLVSGYRHDEVPCEPLAAGALLRVRARDGFGINLLAVPNTQSGAGFVGLQVAIPIR